jgi:hypothetical protein
MGVKDPLFLQDPLSFFLALKRLIKGKREGEKVSLTRTNQGTHEIKTPSRIPFFSKERERERSNTELGLLLISLSLFKIPSFSPSLASSTPFCTILILEFFVP